MKQVIADESAVTGLLDKLAREITEKYPDLTDICLVGIKTRGAYIAQRLRERIKIISGFSVALGELDITFYRDDLTLVAQDPQLKSAGVGVDFNGKIVILSDDVLYSGRTVLCALNALARFGRARKVEFLTLVDRGHHCLPLQADYVGRYVLTAQNDIIHVHLKEKDGDDCIVHNIGGQNEKCK